MTQIQAATIATSIREKITQIELSMERFKSPDDWAIRRLLAEAEQLMKADPVEGSHIKAQIFQVCGDSELVRYWIDNARRLDRHNVTNDRVDLILSENLGYFSYAASLFPRIARVDTGFLSQDIFFGIMCGCFEEMLAAAEALSRAQLEVPPADFLDMVRRGAKVLKDLNLEQANLQQVLDVAGEVLRRHSLWWLTPRPIIHTICEEGHQSILYQLKVAVNPAQASDLTDEVIERLVDRDLDFPGLSFSFIGTALAESKPTAH